MQYAGVTWVGLNPSKFIHAEQERDDRGRFAGPGDGGGDPFEKAESEGKRSIKLKDLNTGLQAPDLNSDDRMEVIRRDHGGGWDWSKKEVSISDLIPIQDNVGVKEMKNLRSLLEQGVKLDEEHPLVGVYKGKKYILDGHHRIVNHALKGNKTVLVEIADMGGKE